MFELLLIDVALCAALIMVAAVIMIRRWRRRSGRPSTPASARQPAAAELPSEGMAGGETAIVPGFDADAAQPDLAANVPAQPRQAAQSHARPAAGRPAHLNGRGGERAGQQAAGRAVSRSKQIASYYDEADRPMAEYLAARGWTHRQQTPERLHQDNRGSSDPAR